MQKMHNCFSADTKFLIDTGATPKTVERTFGECSDGEQVTVYDRNGTPRQATVRYYGRRKMQRMHLHCMADGRLKAVTCTPDHRWYLVDGSVTTNLAVGDRLYVPSGWPMKSGWTVVAIGPWQDEDAWCVEEPVTHSFMLTDSVPTGNCDLVNLEDMLQNGTVISGTLIEKPHSFTTACTVTTQIIAQVSSNQYGGQTITLAHLAPFVDVSRQALRKDVRREMEDAGIDVSDDEINRIAEMRVKKEVNKGIQTIQYQVVTLLTTNGQAPFITVFMYLDEVPEGQTREDLALIIRETLNQRIQGVKNEKGVWITPAFPKLIYVLDEDNISEDSKYYDLTVLAAKCTAKRMVPDYISAKIMKHLKGDVYPCMG